MARSLESLRRIYSRSAPTQRGMIGPGPRGGHGRGFGGSRPKNTRQTLKRIFSYLSAYKVHFIFAIICMIVSTAMTLAGSAVLTPILDTIADSATDADTRLRYIVRMLVVLGAIYLLSVVSTYFQSRLMLHVSQKSIEKIRNDLFSKLQSLPVRVFDSTPTGEMMSRFTNDIDNIGTMLDTTILSMISGAITLIGTLALMLYYNVYLTLITIIFIPIFIKCGGLIAKKSSRYYAEQQAALGAANGYIEESVSGQKVVKVFNHEDECVKEFSLLNDDLHEKQFKAQFWGGIVGPVLGNLSQVTYAITAGLGGIFCILAKKGAKFVPKNFTVGKLTVFVNLSRQFSRPINEISNNMSVIFSALAGAERVFKVMDLPPEEADKTDAVTPEIKCEVVFDDVTFGYVPDKVILKNISLRAEPGQKVAFVGSTGAGKTTITNLLNRFYDISSGKITIDGTDIMDFKRDYLRKNIAMVLQDTHLFTGTVMENIRYGRLDATDEEVYAAAKTASAHSFIMRLSDGYNTMIEGDGANLSQGQRQLLNIARAAISKAPILVLDEATSSVDTRTERHIEHGMDRLMANRTTFVIAHRLSTVRNSDIIMVLENGEIIERGTHDELLELKGRYYELYTGKKELD